MHYFFAFIAMTILSACAAKRMTTGQGNGQSAIATINMRGPDLAAVKRTYSDDCSKVSLNRDIEPVKTIIAQNPTLGTCDLIMKLINDVTLNLTAGECDPGISPPTFPPHTSVATTVVPHTVTTKCGYSSLMKLGVGTQYLFSSEETLLQKPGRINITKAELKSGVREFSIRLVPTDLGASVGFPRGKVVATTADVTDVSIEARYGDPATQ